VQHTDMRMLNVGYGASLTFEALFEFSVRAQVLRQNFDGDGAIQARVSRARYTSPYRPRQQSIGSRNGPSFVPGLSPIGGALCFEIERQTRVH